MIGWGALGAFDPAGFNPPAGWSVDRGPVLITAENQAEFSTGSDAISNCGVKALAVQIPMPGGSGDYVYAPPIGWYGVNLAQAAGSADDDQYASDIVWIDPVNNKSYQINACTESSTATAGAASTMTTGGESWSPMGGETGWLIVAAVVGGGLLLSRLFKRGAPVRRAAAARRRPRRTSVRRRAPARRRR